MDGFFAFWQSVWAWLAAAAQFVVGLAPSEWGLSATPIWLILAFLAAAILAGIALLVADSVLKYFANSGDRNFLSWMRSKQKDLLNKKTDAEKEALKLQKESHAFQRAILRRQNKHLLKTMGRDRRFSGLPLFHRQRDYLSGLLAATAPPAVYINELEAFRRAIAFGRAGTRERMISVCEAEEANFDAKQKDVEENRQRALALHQKHNVFLSQQFDEVNERIADLKQAPDDEETLRQALAKWEERLGRPAYRDNFEPIFEKQLEKWIESQPRELTLEGMQKSPGPRQTVVPRQGIFLLWHWLLAFFRWLWSDVLKNPVKGVSTLALPFELFFAYPAFAALANDPGPVAIAAAVVFTVGLYTVGHLAGIAVMRSRVREGSPETATPRLKPWTFAAAAVLIFLGLSAVHVGGQLRGESSQIAATNTKIIALQAELTTINGDASLSPQLRETKSNDVDAKLDAVYAERHILTTKPRQIWETAEAQISAFIYFLLFASAMASRIVSHDPVFEFSITYIRWSGIEELRINKLIELGFLRALIVHIKHVTDLQIQQLSDPITLSEQERAPSKASRARLADFDKESADQIKLRSRTFANGLLRFRPSQAGPINEALEQPLAT